jgi:hypothetical protein
MKKISKNGQIIEQIEALLIQLKQSLNVQNRIPPRHIKIPGSSFSQELKFSGLTSRIYELIEEGFFSEPKTISDLQKKLKDRGANKPTTTIMPSLKLLIDKKILDRKKPEKGLYKYFKR